MNIIDLAPGSEITISAQNNKELNKSIMQQQKEQARQKNT
jgi:hypothetical protein